MKDLSNHRGKFDCALNLFSSFGYFSTDDENEFVLKQLISTLKSGGKLVLNTINRNFLLSIYKSAFWFKSDSVLTVSASNYDAKTHYNESYMTIKNETTGETSLSYHRMRLYTPDELMSLMVKCGLKDIKTFGDFNGSPLDIEKSSHPFIIGTKG
jgi:hypothetical protein